MRWNRKTSLSKYLRNCSLKTSTKGRLFRTFNSYSFSFKGGLCNCCAGYCPCRAPCPGGEQFQWSLKSYPLQFHFMFSCFTQSNMVRRTKANLCPIMINFHALDVNGCRSKEVISFFSHSVHISVIT